MAQIITVELPWLDSYRAILLHNHLEINLETQEVTKRSPLPHGVTPQYGGIPHQAVLSALLAANGGYEESELYESRVVTLDSNSFRLDWHKTAGADRGIQGTVKRAHRKQKPVEISYATTPHHRKAVLPVRVHEWGFRADTHEGPRSYRWERVITAVEVPKVFRKPQLVIEVKVRGFGLRKRFRTKLFKVSYHRGKQRKEQLKTTETQRG